MWNKIIQICEKLLDTDNNKNWSVLVSEITQKLMPYYQAHSLTSSDESIPYGRYLLHRDAQKRFHIEMHIFSNGYTGEIHCHETWGIFWLISGALFIEDFLYNQNKAQLMRSSLLTRGSACSFHPPESDWHRVRTMDNKKKEQTISLHIYGLDYDLEYGKYLNQDGKMIEGRRSNFKDNELFRPKIDKTHESHLV